MLKRCLFIVSVFFASIDAGWADDALALQNMQEFYGVVNQFCDGISDQISSVFGIARTNTVVTAVGTVAAGGALAAGIAKAEADKKIEELQNQICDAGGCDLETLDAMSDQEFMDNVLYPLTLIIAENQELARLQSEQEAEIKKSKQLGNWRTGLLFGSVGANTASAIIAGLNKNQSELIQQITACNAAVDKLRDVRNVAIQSGINPLENPILAKYGNVVDNCGNLNANDVEKVEKRMTVVMGTGIGGAVVGAVGAGTSIAANSDKVRNDDSESGKKKEKNLNTVSNVAAGVATATGTVGTGFNISLISLTKKLLKKAETCEATLQ